MNTSQKVIYRLTLNASQKVIHRLTLNASQKVIYRLTVNESGLTDDSGSVWLKAAEV